MAFSKRLQARVVAGNMKNFFYQLTDVQTSGTSFVTEQGPFISYSATNETDNADVILGTITVTNNTKNSIGLVAASANDDGTLILYR